VIIRVVFIAVIAIFLFGCSEEQMTDFMFKQSLKRTLIEKCGEEDKLCLEAVEKNVGKCIEKADGRRFLKDVENEKEIECFTKIFYACFVNRKGVHFMII